MGLNSEKMKRQIQQWVALTLGPLLAGCDLAAVVWQTEKTVI
jgi:hypothetical protein